MRTAILTVFLAAISSAAPQTAPQQDPSKPSAEQAPSQPKPADAPITVLCAPLTTLQSGMAYNSAVVASGGTGVYRFAITSGALPAGMALNPSTGAISGTPAGEGAFSYTIQATDSAGAMATTGSTPCAMQLAAAAVTASGPAPVPAAKPPVDTAPASVPSATPAAVSAPGIAQPAIDPAGLAPPRSKAVAAAAQGVPKDDHPYILGAEDQIQVLIYGSPEFGGPHMIRPDGKITMPFLGDVVAAGLAPSELGNVIREQLKKYIVDPDVSVSVTAVNSKRFYIQGEVNKPGQYTLLVATRVLEALVNAGGFKDFANQKKIVIMRVTGERLNFNYKEVIKGKKMDQNIYLKPGDIIIVK